MVVWALRRPDRGPQLRLIGRVLAEKLPESAAADAAWALPRSVAYWAFIRVMAAASQHPDGRHQHPDEITYSQAAKRWTE
jgi:hypothetical protein